MQDKKESPPILERFARRDTPAVERPMPDIVRHQLAVAEDEPEGYNPYDKPPPPVTEKQLQALLDRRQRIKPGG
jgi:hypothetical protein